LFLLPVTLLCVLLFLLIYCSSTPGEPFICVLVCFHACSFDCFIGICPNIMNLGGERDIGHQISTKSTSFMEDNLCSFAPASQYAYIMYFTTCSLPSSAEQPPISCTLEQYRCQPQRTHEKKLQPTHSFVTAIMPICEVQGVSEH
jgi:hypothetical protein